MADKIWCKFCQDWIDPATLRELTNDADQIEFLCPGCGDELKPRISIEP